jgi:tetratricopeptide (TPR) repeat protein
VLIADTGRRFFSRNVGLMTGLLAAFCPTAIFYDGMIHNVSLGYFCTVLLLYLMSRHGQRPQWTWPLLTGLTLGALILLRQNTMLFAGIILLWLAAGFRESLWRSRLAWMGAFTAGICTVLFPVAIRNHMVGGEFILTTSNFGMNFYIGNNAEAEGTYAPLRWGRGDWSFEYHDVVDLAQRAEGRTLTASEVSRHWTRRALADIASDPWRWVKLLVKKWLLTWNAVEISDSESIYAHGDRSIVLKILGGLMHYGILVPLVAVGLWAGWPRRQTLWPVYLMLIGYALSITMIFVFARYRHPLTAIMLPFAAAGILYVASAVRNRQFKTVLASGLVLAAVAALVNVEIVSKDNVVATTYYNLASTLDRKGERDQAVQFYRLALDHNPAHAMAMNNLAIVLYKSGQAEEAKDLLRQAHSMDDTLPEVHNNMALIAASEGKYKAADHHFRRVVALNPDYSPSVYYNLACIAALTDETEDALDWLEKAVARGYQNWQAIQTDPDLINIRGTERYRRLIADNTQQP